MDPIVQVAISTAIPTFTVLLASILTSHQIGRRIDTLERHIENRFNDMDRLFSERLRRVEEVMDARLTRIEGELKIR